MALRLPLHENLVKQKRVLLQCVRQQLELRKCSTLCEWLPLLWRRRCAERSLLGEGERRVLNPRPLEPQSSALPTELRPPLSIARNNIKIEYVKNQCVIYKKSVREKFRVISVVYREFFGIVNSRERIIAVDFWSAEDSLLMPREGLYLAK
jgi:hypothetical protein